jgi:hypothetical protein
VRYSLHDNYVVVGEKTSVLTEFSDSVFSLANREEESISLSSAMVLSSSDLTEKDKEEEEEEAE